MSNFLKNLLITVLVLIVLWYLFTSSCAHSLKKKLCNVTCGTCDTNNNTADDETIAERMTDTSAMPTTCTPTFKSDVTQQNNYILNTQTINAGQGQFINAAAENIEAIGVHAKNVYAGSGNFDKLVINNVDITDKLSSLGAPLNTGTTLTPTQVPTYTGTPIHTVNVAPIEATGESCGTVSGNSTTGQTGANVKATSMLIETYEPFDILSAIDNNVPYIKQYLNKNLKN